MCAWACLVDGTQTICSGPAQQRILRGEMQSAGADVPEEGVDFDWNGSRGEMARGVYQRFTQPINADHTLLSSLKRF